VVTHARSTLSGRAEGEASCDEKERLYGDAWMDRRMQGGSAEFGRETSAPAVASPKQPPPSGVFSRIIPRLSSRA